MYAFPLEMEEILNPIIFRLTHFPLKISLNMFHIFEQDALSACSLFNSVINLMEEEWVKEEIFFSTSVEFWCP